MEVRPKREELGQEMLTYSRWLLPSDFDVPRGVPIAAA